MKFENLSKEDIQLIKRAMLENAVTLTSEALECEYVMPKEVCEKNMSDSDRLIYLVNFLDGAYEYDKKIINIANNKEKELILQGLDLLIEETEYAIEHGDKGLKEYRENKLSNLNTLKKKIIDSKITISN